MSKDAEIEWTPARLSRAESLFSQAEIEIRRQAIRLAPIYQLLKWKWGQSNAPMRIPTAEEIKRSMRSLLLDCKGLTLNGDPMIPMRVSSESGGLFVEFRVMDHEMTVRTGFQDEYTQYEGANRLGRWDDEHKTH